MDYSVFDLAIPRGVTLCGTNVYPTPEYHLDRILPEHDLMFVVEGTWEVAQDDVIYPLHAGDLLLLHAGCHHWGTAPCSINSRNMFIHFQAFPTDRCHVSLTVPETQAYMKGTQVCIPPLVHIGLGTQTVSIFHEIISLYWSHQENRERRLVLLLALLLNDLSYLSKDTHEETEEWIVRLLEAFHEHPDRFFSLDEAAEITGMSVRTFSTRFHRIMGKSAHQYQLDEKLEGAYNRLRTGSYTVKEVSDTFGFSDAYYFSRVFKKRFGVPPSEIKKREPSANINRPQFV